MVLAKEALIAPDGIGIEPELHRPFIDLIRGGVRKLHVLGSVEANSGVGIACEGSGLAEDRAVVGPVIGGAPRVGSRGADRLTQSPVAQG